MLYSYSVRQYCCVCVFKKGKHHLYSCFHLFFHVKEDRFFLSVIFNEIFDFFLFDLSSFLSPASIYQDQGTVFRFSANIKRFFRPSWTASCCLRPGTSVPEMFGPRYESHCCVMLFRAAVLIKCRSYRRR